jgi:hypothetical protein
MAKPVTSLYWKDADEEAADRITIAPVDAASGMNREKKLRRHSSQRMIDPKSAIPIEHRSLYRSSSSRAYLDGQLI